MPLNLFKMYGSLLIILLTFYVVFISSRISQITVYRIRIQVFFPTLLHFLLNFNSDCYCNEKVGNCKIEVNSLNTIGLKESVLSVYS